MKFYRVLFADSARHGGKLGEAFLCQSCRDVHDDKIAAAIIETRWDGKDGIVPLWQWVDGPGIDREARDSFTLPGSVLHEVVRCHDCGGHYSILRDR